jgi:hypothetical protein
MLCAAAFAAHIKFPAAFSGRLDFGMVWSQAKSLGGKAEKPLIYEGARRWYYVWTETEVRNKSATVRVTRG